MQQLKPALSSPAHRLIAATVSRNWELLAINLLTNVSSALLEGCTLGVIYLALSLLSQGSQSQQLAPILERALLIVPLPRDLLFLGMMGAAVILQSLLAVSNYCNKLSAEYLSARAQPQVTGRVFERIMSFSFACASHYKIGDLVLFANDAALTVNNQIQLLNGLIVNLSFSVIYGLTLVALSPVLALVAVFMAIIITLMQRQLLPRLQASAHRLNLSQVEVAKRITENIQALRLLHTFGTQQQSTNEVISLLRDVQRQLQQRARILYLPEPILDVLPILSLAILATLAYSMSSTREMLLPLLGTFLLALQRLSIRLRSVAGAFSSLADNSARLQRLDSILASHDKQFAQVGGELFQALQTDISFESVSLSYAGDRTLVLHDLNFKIPRNQVTALVGPSGAGKSSIVDLLIGLYQPSSGQIMVNGKPLQHYNQADWRQRIGVVSQDTFIFNSSILENLRYGALNATFEEVIEAAKTAQAHRFIQEMPDGYETVVGERGYRLSGGQRQRLALARAILKQPEVLILDEATSALDSESERLIQYALAKFQLDRTVIVVAHRLSTIVEADQILVLEGGQLVEMGNHRKLIQERGRYAHYWDLQTQRTTTEAV